MKNVMMMLVSLMAFAPAFAQETAAVATSGGITDGAIRAIAAAIAISVAALGGTLGQGKIGAAAMDGISRNPAAQKAMFTPFILGLALVESLVILAFVVVMLIK